ncbi:MAG: hypothetical protein AAFR79_18580 [Pseudomonadota bacterium]
MDLDAYPAAARVDKELKGDVLGSPEDLSVRFAGALDPPDGALHRVCFGAEQTRDRRQALMRNLRTEPLTQGGRHTEQKISAERYRRVNASFGKRLRGDAPRTGYHVDGGQHGDYGPG